MATMWAPRFLWLSSLFLTMFPACFSAVLFFSGFCASMLLSPASSLPERHRFSTRLFVLPIFYVCYLQYWIRFYVVQTEISLALPCRVHRHSLFSAFTVYLVGHTAVQSSVAEGFCFVGFEEDSGSKLVFRFDTGHVHDRTPLPVLLRRC